MRTSKPFLLTVALAAVPLMLLSTNAWADVRSKAASEVAEYVAAKFGKAAVKEGVEVFSKRVSTAAARHGEQAVFAAVRKVGPKGLHAIEQAGDHGGKMARLISEHGEDAVIWVAKRPSGLAMLAQHGESAGAVLCKHKAIAEPLVEKFGGSAVHALSNVGSQNGRRLAIMAESGELARIGRTEQILGVIGKYGEKAGNFVWNHKGALAVSTVLVTFLNDPEPFIDGTVQLVEPIMEVPGKLVDNVVAPVVQAPAKALVTGSEEIAKRTNWTIILGLLGIGTLGLIAMRMYARHKRAGPVPPPGDGTAPGKIERDGTDPVPRMPGKSHDQQRFQVPD